MGLFRLILKSALTDDRGCVDYNVLSRNHLHSYIKTFSSAMVPIYR